MYAIIQTGAKQYKVELGDIIDIELLNTPSDSNVTFKEILLFNDGAVTKIGAPHIEKCLVEGEVIEETKGPKTIAYKYKKRKSYKRKVGHRQKYTRVKITKIALVEKE